MHAVGHGRNGLVGCLCWTWHEVDTYSARARPVATTHGGGSTEDLALGSGADGRFSVVVFFRGLHCPVCRKQLSELDRCLGDVRAAGVGRVVAVSMETPERSEQLVQQWHVRDLPVAYGLSEASARE